MNVIRTALRATVLATTTWLAVPAVAGDTITVYKSPNCGCCSDWVDHLKDNDFDVTVKDTQNINEIKIEAGLTRELASCHTAFVDEYVIEGHVPAQEIRTLIDNNPQAKGLAVPGMPIGSPGMEMGERKDNYTVLLFNEDGQSKPYASYPQ